MEIILDFIPNSIKNWICGLFFMGRGYGNASRPSLALFWAGDAWLGLFGKSREALISYFKEITANPWEHVFFKYMFQTYKGPIQIDAPSKVIAMLQSMSSNGYQKRIIVTQKLFCPGRLAKTRP